MITVTFDQIEENADRALAYALLVRLARNYVITLYRLKEVSGSLGELLSALTPERVERLAADESETAIRLRGRLEDIHRVLANFARSTEASNFKTTRLPGINLVAKLQDVTEELGDIVETIELSRNADFKNLVSCCTSTLGFTKPEGIVGDVHS